MSNPFRKVRPGEKIQIPAEAYNAFIDAALDYKRRKRNVQPATPTRVTVLVKNHTTQDCPRFGVLQLNGPLFLPGENLDTFQNSIAFFGSAPTTTGMVAIAQEPIRAGAMGACLISGITICKVLVPETDTGMNYGRSTNDSFEYLDLYYAGQVRILWHEQGEGVKWAIGSLEQGHNITVRFVLLSSFNSEGLAPAKIVNAANKRPISDTIYVYDPLSLYTGLAGKYGYAIYMPDTGHFEVVQMEC